MLLHRGGNLYNPIFQVAAEGAVSADEPLQLKGDLDNIGSSSDEDDDDNNADPDQSTKKKKSDDVEEEIYKIPKISQTRYGKILLPLVFGSIQQWRKDYVWKNFTQLYSEANL